MRSTMQRAFASPEPLTLRGVVYSCSPLRIGHFAEARGFLAGLAPDPVKELADDQETFNKFTDPEVRKALALKALELREENRSINSATAMHWINSVEGILFLFWCTVRDNHKELSTLTSIMERFPPGQQTEDGELSIPECMKIQKKIDDLTMGTDDAVSKKKQEETERRKKLKKLQKMKR